MLAQLFKRVGGSYNKKQFEPHRQETDLRTCAPSEDSDQPAHLRSLLSIFPGQIFDSREFKVLFTDNED